MDNSININGHNFSWGSKTYIMGIINVTPDSFSGDGLRNKPDYINAAMVQAESFIKSGADILDVGGESTRPGSKPISSEEELNRVLPVIESFVSNFDIPISIDTYKADVAENALKAGANIINDIWGLKADPNMAGTAAQHDVPVILMHNRSNPKSAEVKKRLGGRYIGVEYDNLIEDIKKELMESVEIAKDAGIDKKKIILDSGIGFGKTIKQNLELLNRTNEIKNLGYPVLVGPSRKSFIGYTLDLPPDQREEGTAASIAVSIVRGADIVRVHNVELLSRVIKMTDAIVRG